MKMYIRVAEYLKNAGLAEGFTVQYLKWRDAKNKSSKFIVFRPNGGSTLKADLGNEYYTLVDLVGAVNDIELIDNHVSAIADHIKNNPYSDRTGLIQVVGAIPAPIMTEDDRLVYRILVSCKFG
jgi:hypothetical protein